MTEIPSHKNPSTSNPTTNTSIRRNHDRSTNHPMNRRRERKKSTRSTLSNSSIFNKAGMTPSSSSSSSTSGKNTISSLLLFGGKPLMCFVTCLILFYLMFFWICLPLLERENDSNSIPIPISHHLYPHSSNRTHHRFFHWNHKASPQVEEAQAKHPLRKYVQRHIPWNHGILPRSQPIPPEIKSRLYKEKKNNHNPESFPEKIKKELKESVQEMKILAKIQKKLLDPDLLPWKMKMKQHVHEKEQPPHEKEEEKEEQDEGEDEKKKKKKTRTISKKKTPIPQSQQDKLVVTSPKKNEQKESVVETRMSPKKSKKSVPMKNSKDDNIVRMEIHQDKKKMTTTKNRKESMKKNLRRKDAPHSPVVEYPSIQHLRKGILKQNISITENHPQQQQQQQQVKQLERGGLIVLGMHRSGTSMLTGLLVEGYGYNVGEPLIQPAFDNEKGFFEYLPVVLQNDAFMYDQEIDWADNVVHYDTQTALNHLLYQEEIKISFREGERALTFVNNPQHTPWISKDPRMCITLRTWLPLLQGTSSDPAILFTYRHPHEVASSLVKREKFFTYEKGLRLWINYNMRAIQNSHDLCRVISSNERLLDHPLKEVQRIVKELTETCHLIPPPSVLTQDVVDTFVDVHLQHTRKTTKQKLAEGQTILQRFPLKNGWKKTMKKNETDGNLTDLVEECIAFDYRTEWVESSVEWKRERKMYLRAMKVFCDLESGAAYEKDYEWPDMLHE